MFLLVLLMVCFMILGKGYVVHLLHILQQNLVVYLVILKEYYLVNYSHHLLIAIKSSDKYNNNTTYDDARYTNTYNNRTTVIVDADGDIDSNGLVVAPQHSGGIDNFLKHQ